MPFFGFVPSEELLKNIQTGIEKKTLTNHSILYVIKQPYSLMKKLLIRF